jgi:hypothetical protein
LLSVSSVVACACVIYLFRLFIKGKDCATSQKFAGSIPDDDIGIFHCHNPSGLTMDFYKGERLRYKLEGRGFDSRLSH